MQSPGTRSQARPGAAELMDQRLTPATSPGPGKKLYQEEDIGKLAVMRDARAETSVATKYVMCVAAASVAEFATYPLDLTKTRLQIQGEMGGGGQYRGMIKTALGIAREEVSHMTLYYSQLFQISMAISLFEKKLIMHDMQSVKSMASCSSYISYIIHADYISNKRSLRHLILNFRVYSIFGEAFYQLSTDMPFTLVCFY